ncbi:alpha/beta hydrolase [Pseudomonas tolaasii]|nr:alpha/beta hydrolase [Pseudomonas tolaasii]
MELLVDTWLRAATQDSFILRAAAGLDHQTTISSSSSSWKLVLANDVAQVERNSTSTARPTVEISASDDKWEQLLTAETVVPGWQGFGAIKRFNEAFTITADDLVIAQCLPILERLIELTYGHLPTIPAPAVDLDPTQVHGNYSVIKTAYFGENLVYWEPAGRGTPVLFLRTAGANARQYRHQLSDVALAFDRSMFAFDMPGHGHSDMPENWADGKPYELSLEKYLEVCSAFIEQVIGEPVVVVSCSIGAAMFLVIAARQPDLVKCVIALEAPWRSPGRKSTLLRDARVNPSLQQPCLCAGHDGPPCTPSLSRRSLLDLQPRRLRGLCRRPWFLQRAVRWRSHWRRASRHPDPYSTADGRVRLFRLPRKHADPHGANQQRRVQVDAWSWSLPNDRASTVLPPLSGGGAASDR